MKTLKQLYNQANKISWFYANKDYNKYYNRICLIYSIYETYRINIENHFSCITEPDTEKPLTRKIYAKY